MAQGGATKLEIKVDGRAINEHELQSMSVDQDLSQPDMCMLVLANPGHRNSNMDLGAEVEVKVGDEAIFQGELVAVEPKYAAGEDTRCVLRAYNRLHRLLRGRKSRTYLDMSDQDIASQIASDSGLSAQTGSDPKITHKHIYQHNQTDLEFLRLRASRIGFEVWVDDTTMYFKPPELDQDSGLTIKLPDPGADDIPLKSFAPKMSSAGMVEKVVVRGWNPEKKEEIVGEAKVSSSRLGTKTGVDASKGAFGNTVTYQVDHPIFNVEEATAIAESRLEEALMGYITGEGTCIGDPRLKAGIVVSLVINNDDENDRFNGKYLLVGATHRYSHSRPSGAGGGFVTQIRVSRDAEKGS